MYELTPWHEAGHAVCADALGRRVTLVTAEPGELFSGVCRYSAALVRDDLPRVELPLITWGAGWQRRLGGDVVVLLAGGLAEELFAPRAAMGGVRLPEGITAQAQDHITELAGAERAATAEEMAAAARAVSTPHPSDAEQIAEIAYNTHGGDLLRSASWLHWLSEECRALLLANEGAVRRMAGLLQLHGTLGERAAAAALRPEGVSRG